MKVKIHRLILVTLLASLALYPLFFKLDFSKSNYEFFDIINMVPAYAWFYLFSLCLLFSLQIWFGKRNSLIQVIIASLLFYGLYTISQYPIIINGDSFSHGGRTERMILNGGTKGLDYYPKWWPGAFVFWVCLCNVTGLNVIDANILLIFIMVVVWSIFFYLLARKFLGPRWAGLSPILYLLTNAYAFHWMGRDHFSPQSFAFTQYPLVLYLVLHILRDRGPKRASLVVVTSSLILCITVSHGYTSFFLVSTLLGICIFEKINTISPSSQLLLLFALTSFFAWWIFNAGSTFKQAILYLSYFVSSPVESKISGISVSFVQENLPLIGIFLRNYYFKPLIIIVGLLAMIVAFKERKLKAVSLYNGTLVGGFAASVISLVAPMGAPLGQLSEVLMLMLIPVCYLASRFLAKTNTRAKITSCIIVLLIVPSVLTMFTYSSEYASSIQRWEVAADEHLANFISSGLIVGTDSITQMIYRYYNPRYSLHAEGAVFGMDSINCTQWIQHHPTFFDGNIIFRSLRQEVSYNIFSPTFQERCNFWAKVDSNLVNNRTCIKIYDNRYVQMYSSN